MWAALVTPRARVWEGAWRSFSLGSSRGGSDGGRGGGATGGGGADRDDNDNGNATRLEELAARFEARAQVVMTCRVRRSPFN